MIFIFILICIKLKHKNIYLKPIKNEKASMENNFNMSTCIRLKNMYNTDIYINLY